MPLLNNGIVMWSGTLNEIPEGWVLCNGSNGTPDLRNKFIVEAGDQFQLLDTGGSANTILVEHSHTVSGSTNATAASHTHVFYQFASTAYANRSWGARGSYTNKTSGASGAHVHSMTLSLAGTGENGVGKNLPPYYALAYIMQVD